MDKYLNVNGENAELLLHGIVGREIKGTEVANKLKALKDLGVKRIKQRISSVGGSIIEGYSIVAANLDLTANGIIVETINEGVSDSMSSVILASGTKGHRKARDYATSVIHNPLFSGTSLNDMKDEGIKSMLTAFKNSLLAIYAAALGKTKEELSETMNEEKMLNAEQMKEIGLIDEIITTDINLPDIKNLSLAEIMNVYEGLDNQLLTKKGNKMKRMNEFHNLSSDASEDSLLDAAKAERQKLTDATAEVNDLKINLKTKTEELDAKVKELEKFEDVAIENVVKAAIDSGKYDEKDKESLTETAKDIGIENFNTLVSKMKIPHVDVNNLIVPKKGEKKGEEKEKLFEDYNSTELEELKIKTPEKYEALVTEFNERD